jgi:hypothetical protein
MYSTWGRLGIDQKKAGRGGNQSVHVGQHEARVHRHHHLVLHLPTKHCLVIATVVNIDSTPPLPRTAVVYVHKAEIECLSFKFSLKITYLAKLVYNPVANKP